MGSNGTEFTIKEDHSVCAGDVPSTTSLAGVHDFTPQRSDLSLLAAMTTCQHTLSIPPLQRDASVDPASASMMVKIKRWIGDGKDQMSRVFSIWFLKSVLERRTRESDTTRRSWLFDMLFLTEHDPTRRYVRGTASQVHSLSDVSRW